MAAELANAGVTQGERPPLPLPAKVLVAFALLVVAGRLVAILSGSVFDWSYYPSIYRVLDRWLGVAYVAFVALALPAAVGLLARRGWARWLFIVSWCLCYVAVDIVYRLSGLLSFRVGPEDSVGMFWRHLVIFNHVVVGPLYAGVVASYLCSSAVKQAAGDEAAPAPEGVGAAPAASRLPLPATILALYALTSGAVCLAEAGLTFHSLGPFLGRLLSFELFDPATARRLGRPLLVAFAGFGSVLGAGGLLARQNWGRWTLIASFSLLAMAYVGSMFAFWSFFRESRGTMMSLPVSRVAWELGSGSAWLVLHCLFLVAYLCSKAVGDAVAGGD